MTTNKYVPASEVLRGVELMPVAEGWTPIEAIVLVKCMTEDGTTGWMQRVSQGISTNEAVGALICSADTMRSAWLKGWDDETT